MHDQVLADRVAVSSHPDLLCAFSPRSDYITSEPRVLSATSTSVTRRLWQEFGARVIERKVSEYTYRSSVDYTDAYAPTLLFACTEAQNAVCFCKHDKIYTQNGWPEAYACHE